MKKRIGSRVPEWGCTVAEELLRPTRIYVRPVLSLLKRARIRGMAHITGGGIPGNLPRSIPDGLYAAVERDSWPIPPVFETLREAGRLQDEEAFRTFNMGIGMILIVRASDGDMVFRHLQRAGIPPYRIGEIRKGRSGPADVRFAGRTR